MMSLRPLTLAVLAVLLLIAPARASDGSAADLLAAVNRVRSGAGLPVLAVNPRLACAARRHARDIAGRGRLDHVGGDGADLATRLARVGYLYARAAENLALAGGDVAEVMALWQASPGHRRNMLDAAVTEAGVGRVPVGDRVYWVLELGRRRGESPEMPGFPRLLADCNANPG